MSERGLFPRPLLALLVIGAVLRTGWALLVPMQPTSDPMAYHTFALTLVEHGVYGWTADQPSAYWAVGTSAVLAALYSVFGVSFTPVVILNILVSLTVIAQVFWLARQYADARTALIAAALITFWPSLIMFVTVIASEIWFICLILAGWLAFERRDPATWTHWLLAALFWAAACYLRSVALLLPVIFGLAALLRGEIKWTTGVLRIVVVLGVIAALIAPWSQRNERVFGERVVMSTNFGPNFWMGNHPGTSGEYTPLPDWAQGLSEIERDARLKAEALDYIRAEPGAFVTRTAWKLVLLHGRETIAVGWNAQSISERIGDWAVPALKLLATGYWLVVLGAGLAGLALLAHQQGAWGFLTHPLLLYWGYFAALHAIIVVGDRYRLPAIPAIAILAAMALAFFIARYRGGTAPAPQPTTERP